jgi:hypothetical protein
VPSPSVQWFKNGEPIYPSEYFQFSPNHGNLKILGIIGQDEGYYQCLASNELNTIQSVAKLAVLAENESSNDQENQYQINDDYESDRATPIIARNIQQVTKYFTHTTTAPIVHLSSPESIRLVKSNSRSILIEWQSPSIVRDSNNSNLYYAINWKSKTADRMREINTTNTSCLIDDLAHDTLYTIQVSAILSSIRGPSSSIEVKTDAEPLFPSQPVDFKAEFIDLSMPVQSMTTSSVSALKLKWKRPQFNFANILKYRLYYQHLHFGPLTSADIKLRPGSEDFFQPSETVAASSQSSSSSSSDYLEFSDQNGVEENLMISGDIESEREEKFIDIDLPNDSTYQGGDSYYEFLLEDLFKYSTYKFKLVALDRVSFNESDPASPGSNVGNSAEIIVETPSDVPEGAPENLRVQTLNTTSILIEWDQPSIEKRNGLIIGYKISIKENDKQIWHSNVDSESRNKIISGLLPGTKYSVRITAKTGNGSGPASDWIIAETFAHEMDETRAPGQPQDLNAEPTDKSIIIRWKSPSDSEKTLVRKYLLRYGIGYPENEAEIAGNQNSFIINNLSKIFLKVFGFLTFFKY